MKSMKTLVVCSGLALSAAAAHAASLTMDVPFAFSAGGKDLPAGSYTLESDGPILALRGLSGAATMMVIRATPTMGAETKLYANFTETPSGTVLASVNTPDGLTYLVAPSKRTPAIVASPPAGAVLSKQP